MSQRCMSSTRAPCRDAPTSIFEHHFTFAKHTSHGFCEDERGHLKISGRSGMISGHYVKIWMSNHGGGEHTWELKSALRRCPQFSNPTDHYMALMKNEEKSKKLLKTWERRERAYLTSPKEAPQQAPSFSSAEVRFPAVSPNTQLLSLPLATLVYILCRGTQYSEHKGLNS